jgi:hypothetical protein
VHRQSELLHVVLTLRTRSGGPHLSDRRQQQADEDDNDPKDYQQLDVRKAGSPPGQGRSCHDIPSDLSVFDPCESVANSFSSL